MLRRSLTDELTDKKEKKIQMSESSIKISKNKHAGYTLYYMHRMYGFSEEK